MSGRAEWRRPPGIRPGIATNNIPRSHHVQTESALSMLALSLGTALAGSPFWVTTTVTSQQVKIASNIIGSSSPHSEGTPVFFVEVNGTFYIGNYSGDKAKAQLELAKQALASGKKVSLYVDTDLTISYYNCTDFSSSDCTSKNSAANYVMIQELAISP